MWRTALPFLLFLLGPLGALLVLAANTHNATFWKGTFLSPLLCLFGHPVVSDFGVAFTVGWAVWYFSVYRPEQKKKKILKNFLIHRYNATKEQILATLLAVLKGISVDQAAICAKELQNKKKVMCFFKQNGRWNTAIEKLMQDTCQLTNILRQLEFVNQEAQYVRNNCYIEDTSVLKTLGDLSIVAFKFNKATVYDDDIMRDLSNLLHSMLFEKESAEDFKSIIGRI